MRLEITSNRNGNKMKSVSSFLIAVGKGKMDAEKACSEMKRIKLEMGADKFRREGMKDLGKRRTLVNGRYIDKGMSKCVGVLLEGVLI